MNGPLAGLPHAVGIDAPGATWIVGGGGKTSLMFQLARALAQDGQRVVTATSTHIRVPGPQQSPALIIGRDPQLVLSALRAALDRHGQVTLVGGRMPSSKKLYAAPMELLQALPGLLAPIQLLVEADGSAGRPLKAHAAHEPAVPRHLERLLAVVGCDAVGSRLDEASVHRARLLAQRLGLPLGCRLSADQVARALLAPWGTLARAGPGTRCAVFISRSGPHPGAAQALVEALRAADLQGRLARIAWGELVGPDPWVDYSSTEISHS